MTSDTLASSDTATRLGRALGSAFEVVRLLGRGGFAEVYEVRDTELRRRLAVKVLRPDLPWGPRTLTRFLQEARTLAQLNHPHTLPIYFVSEGEGLVYYAMPFLDGGSLGALIQREAPLDVPRALALILPVVDALAHAHAHGIIHRDVKPDNIVIEAGTGRPLLVDFGIARALDGAGHHTEAGFVVGTPLYMSPEQALGRPDIDPRADLYAVGAVLFEMLTGRPPFNGNDSQEIVGHHLTQPVPVLAISGDGVPPWLRGVIVQCLAKRPSERYPSAVALLAALRNEEMPAGVSLDPVPPTTGPAVSLAPTERLPRARRRWGRRAVMVVAAASGFLALGAAGMMFRAETTLLAENRFLEPVSLAIRDAAFLLEPGDRLRIPIQRGRRLDAHWALVRPTTRDGSLLGEAVVGTFATGRVADSLHIVITADNPGAQWFTPLIVNATPHAIRISVISARDSADCNCFIAAGDSLAVGYYGLTPETAMRITDVMGRTTRFTGFETLRDPETGRARVLVEGEGMRR